MLYGRYVIYRMSFTNDFYPEGKQYPKEFKKILKNQLLLVQIALLLEELQ